MGFEHALWSLCQTQPMCIAQTKYSANALSDLMQGRDPTLSPWAQSGLRKRRECFLYIGHPQRIERS
jgi:hypothetical protein